MKGNPLNNVQLFLLIGSMVYILAGIALLVVGPFKWEINKAVSDARRRKPVPPRGQLFLFSLILPIVAVALWPLFLPGILRGGRKMTGLPLELEYIKGREIHKSWLQKRLTLEEAENLLKKIASDSAEIFRKKLTLEKEGSEMYHLLKNRIDNCLNPARIRLKFEDTKMEERDELWEFCSSKESWENFAGREGIALVRNGQVIDYILTIMN